MTAGTHHPVERCILPNWPALGLVQGQQVVSMEKVFHVAHQGHLLGGILLHLLKVTIKSQLGVDLHTKDVEAVLQRDGVAPIPQLPMHLICILLGEV